MKPSTAHLGLPFFDAVHRQLGAKLADWMAGQQIDESDDRQAILRMPTRLFAGLFGMKERPYFKAVAGSEKAPGVRFDFGAPPAATPVK